MKRALLATTLPLLVLLVASVVPSTARADDPYGLAPGKASPPASSPLATWGGARGTTPVDVTSVSRDSPITRARDMLTRSRLLDDAATIDEKAATELAGRLPAMRAAAKTARERAERSTPEERELMGARADDLEADVVISEAEVTFKRKTAVDNRRIAHELRSRAVRVVREEPAQTQLYDPTASACDPPFRYTADGRKVYRVECLK
jgi:hypothetical protein